jgi:hypothetical protein
MFHWLRAFQLTATPLVGYKRLQFNIAIHAIDKMDLMKDIPTVLLPILWVQEVRLHKRRTSLPATI